MSCEQCTQGYILPGEPKGSMVDGAYLHPVPEGTAATRAVVLLTDIFGLPLKNSKIIADKLSEELSCDVWVPDLFDGSPPVKAEELEPLMPDRAGAKISFMSKLRLVAMFLPRAHRFIANRPSVTDARVDAFIEKIKKEKQYEKIGAVGYCFGGGAAIRLGAKTLVNSIVICHPSGCTEEQANAIKVPAAWVCAEDDMSFGTDIRKKVEQVFANRKGTADAVDYEFVDYKGTAHGFAARPNLALPEIVDAYNKALAQTVAWFAKTL